VNERYPFGSLTVTISDFFGTKANVCLTDLQKHSPRTTTDPEINFILQRPYSSEHTPSV
jgi:hypothetical protein